MNYKKSIGEMKELINKGIEESPKNASDIILRYTPDSLIKAGQALVEKRRQEFLRKKQQG